MSNPFNSSSQNYSQQNAAYGHQQNVDANHRAVHNHQSGGGGGLGGLLALGFLILVVLLVTGVLG
jgi:hypothetical protein